MKLGKCCVPGRIREKMPASLFVNSEQLEPPMARWFSVRSVAISFLFATIGQYNVMTMRPCMYRPCALFSWSIHLDNASLIVLWTMRPLDDSSFRICDPGRYVLILDRIHGRWIITKDTFFSWALGMSVPDPGSRISDHRSKISNKIKGWKKISCPTFVCSHKNHKNCKLH